MEAHISRSYMIGVRVYVGYEVRQNIADVLRRHHAESERHRVGRLAAAIIFIGFRVEELRIEGAAYSVSLSLIEGCIPTIAEHRCHPRYRNQVFIISSARGKQLAGELRLARRFRPDVVPVAKPEVEQAID